MRHLSRTSEAFRSPCHCAVDTADGDWPFSTGFINEDMIRERLFPGERAVHLIQLQALPMDEGSSNRGRDLAALPPC